MLSTRCASSKSRRARSSPCNKPARSLATFFRTVMACSTGSYSSVTTPMLLRRDLLCEVLARRACRRERSSGSEYIPAEQRPLEHVQPDGIEVADGLVECQ